MEESTQIRVDLNDYSIDSDHSDLAVQFRKCLLGSLARPSAVISYAPTRTLSKACFLAVDTALPLGLFYEHQACFDYKPWVESELRRCGIPIVPWIYTGSLQSAEVRNFLDQGSPIVVRWPRSRGGSGIWLVRDQGELQEIPEKVPTEEFICISPYIASALSVNVNACVFSGGSVTLHATSVQLVGIKECTSRLLGYSGNDFGLVAELPEKVLRELDSTARVLGIWLAEHGYLGAFGFDALIVEDSVLFVELNPRFQASSEVGYRIDERLGRADQYMNHIAAFLGCAAEDELSLAELVQRQGVLSHIVIYNKKGTAVALHKETSLERMEARLLPNPGVVVQPNGILAAILWSGSVTETGRELSNEVGRAVVNLSEKFSPVYPGEGKHL
ncbi:MAG: ATP-grasp domain-containing protein [Thermoanaerobaculia bacterium]